MYTINLKKLLLLLIVFELRENTNSVPKVPYCINSVYLIVVTNRKNIIRFIV